MIESQTGEKISTDAIILQWLVRWAAMLHSRVRRGSDGKTAYERQKGRRCKMEVVPFGECVHYRKLKSDDKNKRREPVGGGDLARPRARQQRVPRGHR